MKLLCKPDCWLLILCTCSHHAIGRWNECWLPLQKLQYGLDISSHLGFKPREVIKSVRTGCILTYWLQMYSGGTCSLLTKQALVVTWACLKRKEQKREYWAFPKRASSPFPLRITLASLLLIFFFFFLQH